MYEQIYYRPGCSAIISLGFKKKSPDNDEVQVIRRRLAIFIHLFIIIIFV